MKITRYALSKRTTEFCSSISLRKRPNGAFVLFSDYSEKVSGLLMQVKNLKKRIETLEKMLEKTGE